MRKRLLTLHGQTKQFAAKVAVAPLFLKICVLFPSLAVVVAGAMAVATAVAMDVAAAVATAALFFLKIDL